MLKKLIVYCLAMSVFISYAQEDAWVYFVDKENVIASISNPLTILTQKAIDRKTTQGIAIDERDVPVNENYITQIKNATGITVFAKSKWFNAVHVRGSETDINDLLNLSFVSDIEFADDDLNTTRAPIPVPDKFAQENARVNFNYGSTQNQVEMLNLHLVHQADFTGYNVTIAVMDAGFPNVNTMSAFQRLRDNGNLLDGYDFVDRSDDEFASVASSHGTRVLSTMAAFVQDQYVGTAPDASYYLFRTEDVSSENPVEESYWVESAERADSLGVDIINTSLGYKAYDNPDYSYSNSDMDGQTAFITRGATIASEKGIMLINSAGNSGSSGVNAPADAADVFSIGAVDGNGDYAAFSSQGNNIQPTLKPDVVARGSGSFIVDQFDAIGQNNGTSFSSPILAGAMACLKQAAPNVSNAQLLQLVRETATQFITPDFFLGHGIPDFDDALNEALSIQNVTLQTFKVFPNPVETDLYITFPNGVDQANVLVFDILGKLILETTVFENQRLIDLSNLASGLYLARLSAANQKSETFKIIKQ